MKKANYERLGFKILSNDEFNPDGEATCFQWRELSPWVFSGLNKSAFIELGNSFLVKPLKVSEVQEYLNRTNNIITGWRPCLVQHLRASVIPAPLVQYLGRATRKPVFTQAMADAGELPPVGSYYNAYGITYVSIAIDDGQVCGKPADGYLSLNQVGECVPTDTRTAREKYVDEAMNHCGISNRHGRDKTHFGMVYDLWFKK